MQVHVPPGHLLAAALSPAWVSVLLKAWLYLLIQCLYPMMKSLREADLIIILLSGDQICLPHSQCVTPRPDCVKNKTRRFYYHCIYYVWLQLQFVQASLSKNLLTSLAYLLCHQTPVP